MRKLHFRLRRKLHLLNDKGSALLTVLLFVAFLSMLATTLMYVVGMNFIIKQADYQNKKNFYTGETALEEIRAMLAEQVVSEAGKIAYNQSCMNYCNAGVGGAREVDYYSYYTAAVAKTLATKIGATGTWTGFLNTGYNVANYDNSKVKIEMLYNDTVSIDPEGKLEDESGSGGTFIIDAANGIVTIRGVEVTYVNEDGVATKISTNLEMRAPRIDWSAEQSAQAFVGTDDQTVARTKTEVDITRCVRYTNWVKE